MLVFLLAAALGASAAQNMSLGAAGVYKPVPFGFTIAALRQARAPGSLSARLEAFALSRLPSPEAAPAGAGKVLLAIEARSAARKVLELQDSQAFDDLFALEAVLRDDWPAEPADARPTVEAALAKARASLSATQRASRLQSLVDLLGTAGVSDALLSSELAELRSRPDPMRVVSRAFERAARASGGETAIFNPDGSRDRRAEAGLASLAESVNAMNGEQLAALGQAYRASMAARFPALGDLTRAETPGEFVAAAVRVAKISRDGPPVEAILGRRAVVLGGILAEEKGMVFYHGRLAPAVEAFEAFLKTSRRNRQGFIEARKWEFRDRLAALLFFTEALRRADSPDAAEALSHIETEMSAEFARSAFGILSFSRLPLAGAVEAAAPALRAALRGDERVRAAIMRGFADARSNPDAGTYQLPRPVWQHFLLTGVVLVVVLGLLNLFLLAMPGLSPWSKIAMNAIALAVLLFSGQGGPSAAAQFRDWAGYGKAQKLIRRL